MAVQPSVPTAHPDQDRRHRGKAWHEPIRRLYIIRNGRVAPEFTAVKASTISGGLPGHEHGSLLGAILIVQHSLYLAR